MLLCCHASGRLCDARHPPFSVRLPELHGLYVLGVRTVSCADANETTAGCAAGVLSMHACVFVRVRYVCVCVSCVFILRASRQVKWSGGGGVSRCIEGHHRGRPGTHGVCGRVVPICCRYACTSDATFSDVTYAHLTAL